MIKIIKEYPFPVIAMVILTVVLLYHGTKHGINTVKVALTPYVETIQQSIETIKIINESATDVVHKLQSLGDTISKVELNIRTVFKIKDLLNDEELEELMQALEEEKSSGQINLEVNTENTITIEPVVEAAPRHQPIIQRKR